MTGGARLDPRDVIGLLAGRMRMKLDDWRDGAVAPLVDPLDACFVVGCGNSGTTLVASRLGEHPDAFTIPRETAMFRPRRRLREARGKLEGWMGKARTAEARCLVEKTPKHVHHIDRVRHLLPEARVVIVQRNPFDTVLSLKTRFRTGVEFGIRRWLLDNAPALNLPEDDRTTRLHFERLTAAPEIELRRLVAFLGLPWDARVLESRGTAYKAVAHKMPTMRLRTQQVAEPIRPNDGKWRTHLSAAEIDRVRARTASLFEALGGDPDSGAWR